MYNIDIDTGGTMTDGLVSGEGTVLSLKVETTPHDVTIAFLDIIGPDPYAILGTAGVVLVAALGANEVAARLALETYGAEKVKRD